MALGVIAVPLLPLWQNIGMQEAHAQASTQERNERDRSRNRGEERFINWETVTERPEAEPFIWGGDGPSQR
ncbi:MAG: hypothetical protein AAGM36_05675 [Cyanobacteria bacterium J06597_1]